MAKKTKKSISILAPKLFDNREIGVTFADKEEKVIGRTLIKYGLELLDNPEKYYYIFHFRIKEVNNGIANTLLKEIETSREFLNRSVKKRTSKIEARIITETRNKENIIFKPFAITISRCNSKIKTQIRKKMEDLLKEYTKEKEKDEIVKDLISNTLQSKIIEEIKKIYPILTFEFRRVEFE